MSEAENGSRSIVVERQLPHPPEKVWRALTQPHLIEEWLMKNDFQPVVGHRFYLRMPPQANWNGVTECEVLAVEPPKRLSYTWNSTGDEAANGLRTVVTWDLSESGGGTRLRMEQSGFSAEQEQNYQGAKYGWQRFLAALEGVVGALVDADPEPKQGTAP